MASATNSGRNSVNKRYRNVTVTVTSKLLYQELAVTAQWDGFTKIDSFLEWSNNSRREPPKPQNAFSSVLLCSVE